MDLRVWTVTPRRQTKIQARTKEEKVQCEGNRDRKQMLAIQGRRHCPQGGLWGRKKEWGNTGVPSFLSLFQSGLWVVSVKVCPL